ncbi:hypothetical protein ACX80E_07790 [Arthrobacter sp. TMN-49]
MNSGHHALGAEHSGQAQQESGEPSKPGRRGLGHVARREWYLFTVDLYLDGKVPGRRRTGILRDLRNSIDAESEMGPPQDVIAGLGPPRELAASYAEGTPRTRVLWTAGVAAAILTLMVYWLFSCTYALGMLAVAQQAGGEFHAHFIFVDVMAFSTADGIGIGWSGNAALWFPLALAALAFIGAGRVWRLFRRS